MPIPGSNKDNEDLMNLPIDKGFSLPELISTVVQNYLKLALQRTHNNKTKAADLLGLPSYQTLTNWLKKYGLK